MYGNAQFVKTVTHGSIHQGQLWQHTSLENAELAIRLLNIAPLALKTMSPAFLANTLKF